MMKRTSRNFFVCVLLFFFPLLLPADIFKQNIILSNPFSDLPVINNYWVNQWIRFFQKSHSNHFRIWLERSYRYAPMMKEILKQKEIPSDFIYLAMIESGFSPHAESKAQALGYWQFIQPTALRFGLRKNYWLDERKDFEKSTLAAAKYLQFLYRQFGDWWLAASAYNMGEKRLMRLIQKHKTKNFWSLAQKYDFPSETAQYIPKFIAAITISKAPVLYGFNYLKVKLPHRYEIFYLPGGTNLRAMAHHINEPYQKIKRLNPALLGDHIPYHLEKFRTRIPKGLNYKVSSYISSRLKLKQNKYK